MLHPLSPAAIPELAAMAQEIWNKYFTPLIGEAQVLYMLEQFQSESALCTQMAQGYQYNWLMEKEARIGYCGLKPEGERLFLSKLYVLKEWRGQGMGQKALEAIAAQARVQGFDTLYLTVNRHNAKAIACYKRNGFIVAREAVKDIGDGFFMDDFIMERTLSR